MATIKARVGPQNVVRVLSSSLAAAPISKLIKLDDVNTTYQQDGMILVWDLPSQTFIMTSFIDSSSTTIQGIAYFENTTDSSLSTNGALVVSGGVGVGKNLNVNGGISIAGVATFSSDVDINASVDISNVLNVDSAAYFVDLTSTGISNLTTANVDGDLTVVGLSSLNNLNVAGVSTLASLGGITTTGGDFYVATDATVGGNLKVDGTSEFIGDVTFRGGTIGIGDANTDDINVSGEFVSNLVPNEDNTYDLGLPNQRWRDGQFSGLVTSTNLNVSGISTFTDNLEVAGDASITGFVSVTEGLYYDTGDYDGPNGIAYFNNSGKLIGAASTESLISSSYYILTTEEVSGVPVWTSTIDGGIY